MLLGFTTTHTRFYQMPHSRALNSRPRGTPFSVSNVFRDLKKNPRVFIPPPPRAELKINAVWILNVLVPRPATMEKQKRWASTAAWWIFRTQDPDTVARGQ